MHYVSLLVKALLELEKGKGGVSSAGKGGISPLEI
jgi:hypothetical protein